MYVVLHAVTKKPLSDLPTAGLIDAWESLTGSANPATWNKAAKRDTATVQARLLPSSPGNAIAYLADGTEPADVLPYPAVPVRLVWR